MRVQLAQLKANPLRDFTVDPIDPARVELLKASMDAHGFWGGIVCRQLADGSLEIAAGHHRVLAALDAGVTEAEVFVRRDVDDAEMIHLYATENATQRGNTSTATAGTVAAAIRWLATIALTGERQQLLTPGEIQTIRDNLRSGRGLSQRVLERVLQGVPGMNGGVIMRQLANRKASGDYARLLGEVEQAIAALAAAAGDAAAQAGRGARQRRGGQGR